LANESFYPSVIELSLSALRKNLRYLRERIGAHARISSVIKGNAYGHGIDAFVPMAERCGVNHFSVFSADEALQASQVIRPSSEITIMGYVDDAQLEWAVEKDISFYVFELERLRGALAAAQKVGKPARVHLELETGLNRTGLDGETLREALDLVSAHPNALKMVGVCTHLAGADSVGNHVRIVSQLKRFREGIDGLAARGVDPGLRHAACSAAAFAYPDSIYDMVRFGIAQYGFWPSKETRMVVFMQRPDAEAPWADPLRRVMTWKSRVMSVKQVKTGEFVGYGTTYLTPRPQRLAAVPVGYFHGFARSLSNLGFVLIQGRRVPVVGLVNMNMLMADVSDLPTVARGDEVVLIGTQRKSTISVASFSDLTRNLNYEVLVRLPSGIPRVVVE